MKQEEFKAIVEAGKANIIDVSSSDKFKERHIEGATNIQLEDLTSVLDTLDKDQEYHVVCRMGIKSKEATALLEQAGFKVHDIEGGMNEWTGETVSSQD